MIRRSKVQTIVLIRLTGAEPVSSVQGLATELAMERASLSRSLHALKDEGLVGVRGRAWYLTERGWALALRYRAELTIVEIAEAASKRERYGRLHDALVAIWEQAHA